MDMMAIDLSACPKAKVGDEVVVWGDDLPCEQLKPFVKVSPYALCTGLHHRVKCTWHPHQMTPNNHHGGASSHGAWSDTSDEMTDRQEHSLLEGNMV